MFDSPLRRRLIVVSLLPKACKEGERKLLGVERLLGERGYGFFDLDGVHASPRLSAGGCAVARKGSTLIFLARRMTSANS